MKDHRQLTDFTGSEAKEDNPSVLAQFEASMGKAKPSLEQQLAAAKADIAKLTNLLVNAQTLVAKDMIKIDKIKMRESKHKAKYNELIAFVSSLQLDGVDDDINLELLLAKHKGE